MTILCTLYRYIVTIGQIRTGLGIRSCHSLQKERKREERKNKSLFLRVDIEEKTRSSRPAFPLFMPKTRERIALLALCKRGNCSRRFLQKERQEQFTLFNEQIVLSL